METEHWRKSPHHSPDHAPQRGDTTSDLLSRLPDLKTPRSPSTRGFPRRLGSPGLMEPGQKEHVATGTGIPGVQASSKRRMPSVRLPKLNPHTPWSISGEKPRVMRYGFGGRLQCHTPPAQEHDPLLFKTPKGR